MSQGELFPDAQFQKSRLDEFIEQKYPVLAVLGVPFNKFSGFSSPYVRIRTTEGVGIFDTGVGLTSQWTDRNEDDANNTICWSNKPNDRGVLHEGFVEAVTSFRENSVPIAHLLHHVTDIQLSSAIRLEDIEELAIYPDNAARVKAMHQNAEVDGDSVVFGRYKGYSVDFSEEELGKIISDFWPEPEVVYVRAT